MTAAPKRAWQRMLSGRRLDLLNPHPDDIAIEDIAHGLSRVARWNGQTGGQHIYSVAQHSLLVEAIFSTRSARDPKDALAALLHDAPEYVVGDLISPFKVVLGDGYKAVENRILDAVHQRFGLDRDGARDEAIKAADIAAARLEAESLAGFARAEADLFFGPAEPDSGRWAALLTPKRADDVQTLFMSRFARLGGIGAP